MHHLSYVRSDEEVREKLRMFDHAHEVVPGWFERVWKGWDADPKMEDLHPTKPEAYKRAIEARDPGIAGILREHGCG
jgi:hypothetical protein